jgi:hypothetical protein
MSFAAPLSRRVDPYPRPRSSDNIKGDYSNANLVVFIDVSIAAGRAFGGAIVLTLTPPRGLILCNTVTVSTNSLIVCRFGDVRRFGSACAID